MSGHQQVSQEQLQLRTWAILGPCRAIVRKEGHLLYDGPPDKMPAEVRRFVDEELSFWNKSCRQ
jgi:hypothetical protein